MKRWGSAFRLQLLPRGSLGREGRSRCWRSVRAAFMHKGSGKWDSCFLSSVTAHIEAMARESIYPRWWGSVLDPREEWWCRKIMMLIQKNCLCISHWNNIGIGTNHGILLWSAYIVCSGFNPKWKLCLDFCGNSPWALNMQLAESVLLQDYLLC